MSDKESKQIVEINKTIKNCKIDHILYSKFIGTIFVPTSIPINILPFVKQ